MRLPTGARAALLVAAAWGLRGSCSPQEDAPDAEACEARAATASLLQTAGGSVLQASAALADAERQQAALGQRLGRFQESLAASASLRALARLRSRLELLTAVDIFLIPLGLGVAAGFCFVYRGTGKRDDT
ncbi:unnamed protein product [Prorocentrum cordatum]|uniref:Uncharacterized protein n=1 Tax=Prorocentrum cordatum TaxID=2364126 RepID=A0ABN9RF69_9DINO|nr:unnamed protein product [Polarella glacialis]